MDEPPHKKRATSLMVSLQDIFNDHDNLTSERDQLLIDKNKLEGQVRELETRLINSVPLQEENEHLSAKLETANKGLQEREEEASALKQKLDKVTKEIDDAKCREERLREELGKSQGKCKKTSQQKLKLEKTLWDERKEAGERSSRVVRENNDLRFERTTLGANLEQALIANQELKGEVEELVLKIKELEQDMEVLEIAKEKEALETEAQEDYQCQLNDLMSEYNSRINDRNAQIGTLEEKILEMVENHETEMEAVKYDYEARKTEHEESLTVFIRDAQTLSGRVDALKKTRGEMINDMRQAARLITMLPQLTGAMLGKLMFWVEEMAKSPEAPPEFPKELARMLGLESAEGASGEK